MRCIRKIRAERGGKVIAAAFDKNDVDMPERTFEIGDRLEVHGAVFPDRGVRATPVSTPRTRSEGKAPMRIRNSASSRV